jgi:uncharacterized LabA/DUF88 family protein
MLVGENRDDRVMVFIDLANVAKAVGTKETGGLRLDYPALVKELVGPRRLIGAFVFDAISPTERGVGDPKKRLHDALRYQGFRVVAREVSYDDEPHQKEVDVALATDLLTGAFRDSFDVAILVSGDRDYVPAVERVRAEGKRVEVAFFGPSSAIEKGSAFSQHLQKVADRVHELDEAPVLRIIASGGS